MVKVKLRFVFLGEVRRFPVESFDEFISKLKLYGNIKNIEDVRMLYKDDENDWVTFSAKDEFDEAISFMKENLLNVKVTKKKSNPMPNRKLDLGQFVLPFSFGFRFPEMTKQASRCPFLNPRDNIHFGVRCDGCNKRNWRGRRFKCLGCPDYDLCEECHPKRALIHGKGHSFREIGTRGFFTKKEEEEKEEKKEEEKKEVEEKKTIPEEREIEEEGEEEEGEFVAVDPVTLRDPNVVVQEEKPKKEEFVYQKQLDLLSNMGFTNKDMNVVLLINNKGNLKKVVDLLLNVQDSFRLV